MRIAELSRSSGIPVPTIKYYLREGLLPPGEFTSPNQARYDDGHLRRLRLIRMLLELGRLPIATIKEVLAELDKPDPDLHHALGCALTSTGRGPIDEQTGEEVAQLLRRRGWEVGEEAPARRMVAEVIAALRQLGWQDMLERIDDYAEIAGRIAEIDLETVGRRTRPDEIVYGAVVGTILGDTLITGLRRLAQESHSAKIYGRDPDC